MEKPLKELSASTLRRLLIMEVNRFIACLDNGNAEELIQIKFRLREILDLLGEKEYQEISSIVLGKNSS
jgi:hypothetical protein